MSETCEQCDHWRARALAAEERWATREETAYEKFAAAVAAAGPDAGWRERALAAEAVLSTCTINERGVIERIAAWLETWDQRSAYQPLADDIVAALRAGTWKEGR